MGNFKDKLEDWRQRACLIEGFDMTNYIRKTNKNQLLLQLKPTFWLHFYCKGAGVEWYDEGLPIPNYLEYANKGYFVAWQVDGYFATQRAIDYLNDTIARVIVTLKEAQPQRLPWKPDTKTADHYYPKIYKLQQISSRAQSISTKRHAPRRADSFSDYVFWAIKLWTEDTIREQGEGLPVVYEALENWALSQFIDKERSTIRAKCRSVWNWYEKRNWTLVDERKFEMTRKERARSNAQAKAEKARKAVLNAVTGMFAEELKKKSGAWHIGKISEASGVSRNIVAKYIKELEQKTIKTS